MAREVTVASFLGPWEEGRLMEKLQRTAGERPDIIILPETWQGKLLPMDAPIHQEMRQIAARHRVYIAQSVFLLESGKQYNSVLLFDRAGELCGRYDKAYPYWGELNAAPATQPGNSEAVFDCDFGKVGAAVCFDANFPQLWQRLADEGAELVIWPSAYAAGSQLQAHALNHHYPIVTATAPGDFIAVDIDGSFIKNIPGKARVEKITLDLDRCIFHENFNTDLRDSLLKESDPKVVLEKELSQEQWFILRSARKEISAREVCRKAGMEELRAYKKRSLLMIDRLRGQNG